MLSHLFSVRSNGVGAVVFLETPKILSRPVSGSPLQPKHRQQGRTAAWSVLAPLLFRTGAIEPSNVAIFPSPFPVLPKCLHDSQFNA